MSDTTDRLSRARLRADHATKLLDHAQKPGATTADLCVALAEHTRSMRELFDATMEAPFVSAKRPAVYHADGPAYRRLRREAVARNDNSLVAALDRLEGFEGTEGDLRWVAALLRARGEVATSDSLLRHVEG